MKNHWSCSWNPPVSHHLIQGQQDHSTGTLERGTIVMKYCEGLQQGGVEVYQCVASPLLEEIPISEGSVTLLHICTVLPMQQSKTGVLNSAEIARNDAASATISVSMAAAIGITSVFPIFHECFWCFLCVLQYFTRVLWCFGSCTTIGNHHIGGCMICNHWSVWIIPQM